MNRKIRLTAAILSLSGVLSATNVYAEKAEDSQTISVNKSGQDGALHP